MSPLPSVQALRFVLMMGLVSLFADMGYEGSRAIVGPYLAQLGANSTLVGLIAGLGECLSYGLRYLSGRWSEKTGYYWPLTLFGYGFQMLAVPLLAWAGTWQTAALLIVAERVGKAIRNPPRNVLLSHAGEIIGHGRAFGLHEALDKFGAFVGPLSVALVLARGGHYTNAFAVLLIPALMTVALAVLARRLYPRPQDWAVSAPHTEDSHRLPRRFWLYLAAAALIALGLPDFALIAFHLSTTETVPALWIPVFYALALGSGGLSSLLLGRLFDRYGLFILIPLTLATLPFVLLVFLGPWAAALLGIVLWGISVGVHDALIPAALSTMIPAVRRASAYGLFAAVYGISWFCGSALVGWLYAHSVGGVVAFCLVAQLAAVLLFSRLESETQRSQTLTL